MLKQFLPGNHRLDWAFLLLSVTQPGGTPRAAVLFSGNPFGTSLGLTPRNTPVTGAAATVDKIVRQVEQDAEELLAFASELIKIPTVNPPGEHYRECAELVAQRLEQAGFEAQLLVAEDSPQHSSSFPRVNVLGTRCGDGPGPGLHLNGHIDVVPPGDGWSRDPFTPTLEKGRLYGRGSADMKCGLAAALFACEALRRAGVPVHGRLQFSATVDEESGGFAGMAWLARKGYLSRRTTDYVVIPEPLDVDRICLGHRGVYWFKVTARGRSGHGSMPFLGVNAIVRMARLVEAFRTQLDPCLASRRTALPVVPEAAKRPSVNLNSIWGGQAEHLLQTPCVPDRCQAVFDRRFLPEEDFEEVRQEIVDLLLRTGDSCPGADFELEDLMVVEPVSTSANCTLVTTLAEAVSLLLGREAQLVASPGTYDHKHVRRLAGIKECVAYGPGRLELAHQPDEWCSLEDMLVATRVLALTISRLLRPRGLS